MFGRSRLLLIYRDNYNLSRSVSPILRPRFFSRLNQGPRETEVISKEDLGCLPVSLLPSSYTWIASVSSNPTKILSALYHRFIVSSLHLRSFRKVIRPDTLSVKLLVKPCLCVELSLIWYRLTTLKPLLSRSLMRIRRETYVRFAGKLQDRAYQVIDRM